MTFLTTLICILITFLLFAGAYYLARHVIEKQHRVHVLEDAYKEAVDEIKSQAQIIQDKEHEIEQLLHQSQFEGQRVDKQRAWNPSNPLISEPRR